MERYVALFLLSLSLHTDLRVHVRIVVAPPMFYSISRQTHERHGPVISIDRTEEVGELTPFRAVQQAYKAQRAWQEEGVKKVRLVVDGQVMSCKQAEKWAHEEYQTLPKCHTCAKVLGGEVHTHQFCDSHLFCSSDCSDADYLEEMEKLKDEEEIEYL